MTAARAVRYGIPDRMARAVEAMVKRDGVQAHERKIAVIDEVLCDEQRIPLQASEHDITLAAQGTARHVLTIAERYKDAGSIVAAVATLCERMGVPAPRGEAEGEQIARAVDAAWWARSLRKEHARRFEHVAMQIGMTGKRVDPYISRESAMRQARRNAKNAKLLQEITLVNDKGQEYTVAQLADLGTANKEIRRGELMTRIRGFEEIAQDLGHVGLFGTITCPSAFHSVGGTNPRYSGASARDGQAHLVQVWARLRPALDRAGIPVYGFRIVEPHSDGCLHWHTLLFIPQRIEGATDRAAYPRACALIRRYALGQGERKAPKRADLLAALRSRPLTHKGRQEQATLTAHQWRVQERARQNTSEAGAKTNRVKLVHIDPAKGGASAYIAKYVSKNIDGHAVGDHKAKGGYTVAPDLFNGEELTPSQRVTYWAQTHGIRQFQQIGGAPVGEWRELRRVQEETVRTAPVRVRNAWTAVQAVKADTLQPDGTTKRGDTVKQADWKAYLMAQGGPRVGRGAAIKLARIETPIDGKYASYNAFKPAGVFDKDFEGVVYESVRYTWTVKGEARAVDSSPWTGVNNCTAQTKTRFIKPAFDPELKAHEAARLREYLEKNPIPNYPHGPEPDWAAIQAETDRWEAATRDLAMAREAAHEAALARRMGADYQQAKGNA